MSVTLFDVLFNSVFNPSTNIKILQADFSWFKATAVQFASGFVNPGDHFGDQQLRWVMKLGSEMNSPTCIQLFCAETKKEYLNNMKWENRGHREQKMLQ